MENPLWPSGHKLTSPSAAVEEMEHQANSRGTQFQKGDPRNSMNAVPSRWSNYREEISALAGSTLDPNHPIPPWGSTLPGCCGGEAGYSRSWCQETHRPEATALTVESGFMHRTKARVCGQHVQPGGPYFYSLSRTAAAVGFPPRVAR